MERGVAVREWCIDRALNLELNNAGVGPTPVKDVIQTALEIEAYIMDAEGLLEKQKAG